MAKPVKNTTPANAMVILDACPAEKFKAFLKAHLAEGNAVMFSKTRNAKALILTVFSNEGKEREFCEELEELYDALANVSALEF